MFESGRVTGDQWGSLVVLLLSTAIVLGSRLEYDVDGLAVLLCWHAFVILLRSVVRSLVEPAGTTPSELRRMIALVIEQPLHPLINGSWNNSSGLLEFFGRWGVFVFGVNLSSAVVERELRSFWRVLGSLRMFC
jgi:hypothetical protein